MVSTSTKPDMFTLTSGLRARRGQVHVFNPQGTGGIPSTVRWSPLEGCLDPATAIRRAATLSPSESRMSGRGPTNTIPAPAHARAKFAFSDRNP